jgi:hypothetical protein
MSDETAMMPTAGLLLDDPGRAALSPDEAVWIAPKIAELEDLASRTSANYIRMGVIFREIRERLTEGRFHAWIKLRGRESRTEVYRKIDAAVILGPLVLGTGFPDGCPQLGTLANVDRAAVRVLIDASTPEPVQRWAVGIASQGGRLTTDIIRQKVKLHKQEQQNPPAGPKASSLDLLPDRIANATAKDSLVRKARIDIEIHEDGEGDRRALIEEIVEQSDGTVIQTKEMSRSVPEGLENAAETIDGYDSEPPAVDPEPHEAWARAIGAGVAKDYDLGAEAVEEIEATAVRQLVVQCHAYDEAKAAANCKAPCKVHGERLCFTCMFQGYSHLAIQKECRRAAEQLRNAGTYRTKRSPDKIVARGIPEEGSHRALVVQPEEPKD